MKPGDVFEWVYGPNQLPAVDDMMWSSSMQQYVPIGDLSLLISVDGDRYVWLSSKGLFHHNKDDEKRGDGKLYDATIVPRVIRKP